MKRYRDLSGWLKEKFGERVYKVSLTATTSCPNIDGTLAEGGCTFCNDAAFAPVDFKRREKPISLQLQEGMDYIRKRHNNSKFIAYFQSFTSTFGDLKILMRKFEESLEPPDVVGFALSTRPDSIDAAWVSALAKLAKRKFCWVELGLQSARDRTLARINRWETKWHFTEALKLFQKAPEIPVCAHALLGLPGETRTDIITTARFLATQPLHGIKIHNLHVVKGTALAQEYESGKYTPLSFEEYLEQAVDFLEWIPPSFVIHRLNAHAPKRITLAPRWSINKLATFNGVEKELERRDSWQGKALGFPKSALLWEPYR